MDVVKGRLRMEIWVRAASLFDVCGCSASARDQARQADMVGLFFNDLSIWGNISLSLQGAIFLPDDFFSTAHCLLFESLCPCAWGCAGLGVLWPCSIDTTCQGTWNWKSWHG
jgi:hypothetical protein